MGIVDDVGKIAELIKKAGDVELYRQIVKLEGEVVELTREKRQAEEKVQELERAVKFNKELSLKDGLYWVEGDSSPFCIACWDAKRLAVHLKRLAFPITGHRLQCPHCQMVYAARAGA